MLRRRNPRRPAYDLHLSAVSSRFPTVRLYSAWMNVESIVAVVGILIVILAAVYIWLVRSGHGD